MKVIKYVHDIEKRTKTFTLKGDLGLFVYEIKNGDFSSISWFGIEPNTNQLDEIKEKLEEAIEIYRL